jgi:hypothetical protein
MKLQVGMIGTSLGWEELLRQEGVSFAPAGLEAVEPSRFSVVLICRRMTEDEATAVKEFLRGGGSILGYAGYLRGLAEVSEEPLRLTYLEPGEHSRLGGLSLMDVEFDGFLPREANVLRTQDNLFGAFAGGLLGGWAVILPFDPGLAMEDFRAAERYFYARPERLPSERVSRVSKGELLHCVRASLEMLHHARGLPYAHLSGMPAGCENLFALRIDTDRGTREEVDSVAHLGEEFGMGFSWFVDAGSHGGWLERFAELAGHEIGLHCDQHRIFLDGTKDEENMRRGFDALQRAGITVRSFAAPFGFWSPELGKIIDGRKFSYSSEFSWAYDTYPHYPVTGGSRFGTLQVPIHPVSIGNLRKAGYTAAQMTTYFADVAEQKLHRREPLFFYHHPGHHEWQVIRSLCAFMKEHNVRTMTLGAYAEWWQRRSSVPLQLSVDAATLDTRPAEGSVSGDVAVTVTRAGGDEADVALGTVVRLDEILWRRTASFRAPHDVKRIREFDLRGAIGRQFTRLQRRFL